MRIREVQQRLYEMLLSGNVIVELDTELLAELQAESDPELLITESFVQLMMLATILGIDVESSVRKLLSLVESGECS